MNQAIGRRTVGICAGIIAGVSYGTNPLFAKPLLESGVPVLVMLFFRYGISALLLAGWMLLKREPFRVKGRELSLLAVLGLLFACSSLFLFISYEFIPSGLATTLVYLYPVFVALIMVLLRFYPSWQTWVSIAATFGGILLLSQPSGAAQIKPLGILLAVGSALSYAFYLVIVNRSKRIKHVSEHTLTLYALLTGTALFASLRAVQGGSFIEGVNCPGDWANLIGLALVRDIFPSHRSHEDVRPRRVRALDGNSDRDVPLRRAPDDEDGTRNRSVRGSCALYDSETRQAKLNRLLAGTLVFPPDFYEFIVDMVSIDCDFVAPEVAPLRTFTSLEIAVKTA